jgi:hypothetical protein
MSILCRTCPIFGHIFDHNGLSLNPEKVSVIKNYPRPTTLRRLKSYLALTSYFRRYIKDYSRITIRCEHYSNKTQNFSGQMIVRQPFNISRLPLHRLRFLRLPDFNREFLLSTDASQFAISFILSQKDNEGRERVIEYASRSLHKNEINWTVSEKEALAVLEGVRHYHTYLSSRPFQIKTDHLTLSYLKSMRLSGNSRLARWALALQPYQYRVCYRKGSRNQLADALSRDENAPVVPQEEQPTIPPKS